MFRTLDLGNCFYSDSCVACSAYAVIRVSRSWRPKLGDAFQVLILAVVFCGGACCHAHIVSIVANCLLCNVCVFGVIFLFLFDWLNVCMFGVFFVRGCFIVCLKCCCICIGLQSSLFQALVRA